METNKSNNTVNAILNEETNNQIQNPVILNHAFVPKSDNQSIKKTGDNLVKIGDTLQAQPDRSGQKQMIIESRLNRLAEINQGLMGRWTMGKNDKRLLQIDAEAEQDSLAIIRKGENTNLAAVAAYQTRYLKTILHNLVLVGEANLVGAAKLHYEGAKMLMHEKLLKKMEEMTLILEDFENRAMGRPEKFKKVLLSAADRSLEQYGRDFDQHLNEFSELLKKTFSR